MNWYEGQKAHDIFADKFPHYKEYLEDEARVHVIVVESLYFVDACIVAVIYNVDASNQKYGALFVNNTCVENHATPNCDAFDLVSERLSDGKFRSTLHW